MTIFLLYIPFVISLLSGYFLIRLLLKEESANAPLFSFALAGGLGLGISAYIGYVNFLLLNHYSVAFQVICNAGLLIALMGGNLMTKNGVKKPSATILRRDLFYFILLCILFVPIYYMATFYPYGGWDAWAVWHFKAKFLFLSDTNWHQLFDPLLWRSSPHYPLLLPFVNAWGWALSAEPYYQVPLLTSLLFTFLTLALVVGSLASFIDKKLAFLPAVLLLSLPFYAKTAVSQYADVVLGFYLCAGIICLIFSLLKNKSGYAFLSGLFTGFLSFTKPEGLIAAGILSFLSVFFLIFLRNKKDRNGYLLAFLGAAVITLIPSLLFYVFIAPDNVTSINGFLSTIKPTSWERLKTILVYYLIEWVNPKWNGLWIIIFVALVGGMKKMFRKQTLLIFFFLLSYTLAVTLYYWMNTHFEILWWLSVTLNRILASILPLVVWWLFYSLWKKENAALN